MIVPVLICPTPQQNVLAQDSYALAQPQNFLKGICSSLAGSEGIKKSVRDYSQQTTQLKLKWLDSMT